MGILYFGYFGIKRIMLPYPIQPFMHIDIGRDLGITLTVNISNINLTLIGSNELFLMCFAFRIESKIVNFGPSKPDLNRNLKVWGLIDIQWFFIDRMVYSFIYKFLKIYFPTN